MNPRIGSVCTGYGGLDMAVQAVLGGELAWVADPDPGAAAILAHHHPDVPNLGDITTTNWEDVPRVDLLCGGYPCQPFSSAGLQKGVEDERHIWPYIATALRVLRPRYALFENVANHLRIGFDVVLADLAGLGFDVEWCTVRASDVGAPHARNRLFVLAAASDASDLGHERGRSARGRRPGPPDHGFASADASRPGLEIGPVEHHGSERQAAERGRGEPTPADSASAERRGPEPADLGQAAGPATEPGKCAGSPADSAGRRRRFEPGQQRGERAPERLAGDIQWGAFEPAIRRWEHVTGRPAPRPTEPGRSGERLSPAFTEWLMGMPAGHVTAVPGLSRNQQLKALGNGVVPQQATAALQILLERRAAA
jgi:DNA (cytosine-5)-methyltransferase 1